MISRIVLSSLLICASTSALAASTEQNIHHYSSGTIPKSYGTCASLKNSVSDKFKAASGTNVLSAECSEKNHGSVVTVNYVYPGEDGIELNSTRDLTGNSDISGRGYLSTQSECEARKQEITSIFIRATGLTPFMVTCMDGGVLDGTDKRWHVGLDAIGKGNMFYQYIDRGFAQQLVSYPSELAESVKNYFASRPETLLVEAVYRTDSPEYGRMGIAIFTKNRALISTFDGISTKGTKDCATEAHELTTAATRAGLLIAGSGCKDRLMQDPTIFGVIEGRKALSFDSTGITFESMDACRSARNDTFERMRQEVGDDVVGVFCSDSAGQATAFISQKPAN